jgi:hypothetical protein
MLDGGGSLTTQQRRMVVNLINDWDCDWNVDTRDGYICRVEDSDGDGIWDEDWGSQDDLSDHFSLRFIEWMDDHIRSPDKKVKVVVGNSTILPLPGDSPQPSSKGATPSSSF